MSRSKRAIFRNLLTRDIIYITRKTLCMNDIKNHNYTLKEPTPNGFWYYLNPFG